MVSLRRVRAAGLAACVSLVAYAIASENPRPESRVSFSEPGQNTAEKLDSEVAQYSLSPPEQAAVIRTEANPRIESHSSGLSKARRLGAGLFILGAVLCGIMAYRNVIGPLLFEELEPKKKEPERKVPKPEEEKPAGGQSIPKAVSAVKCLMMLTMVVFSLCLNLSVRCCLLG